MKTWFRGFTDAEVRATNDYRLAWLVIIGTIPISVLGFLFKDSVETVARNLWIVATTLVVFGILLGPVSGDTARPSTRSANSGTVTSTPGLRAAAASSSPVNPAPTTTAERARRSDARNARASASVRSSRTSAEPAPGTVSGRGAAPVARTSAE
nr:undecaprenyl-diphosphate phosphatase [Pseudonocardia sp. N23]